MNTITRHPVVVAAVLFMLGIFAYRIVPHRADVLLVMAGLLVAAGAIMVRSGLLGSACLATALFLCGAAAAQVEAFHYPAAHVSAFATDVRRLAHVELKIIDPPRILSGMFGQFRPLPPKQALIARVTRIRTWDGWIDAEGDVLVQIAQPHPRLELGQTVRALGMLERPAPAMNPGQFDWARYYRKQRVLVSLQISQADNIQILSQGSAGPIARLRVLARRALARGFDSERSLDHALARALLLGDRDPELRDVQEQFRRTGTSHHLAISGMHVAVLGAIVYWLCRILRIGPRASAWLGMSFVVLYGLVALPSPPVIRSVLLCIAFGFGIVMGRSVNALQLLALSVLAMLVWEPLDLFDAGFQLSFGTVLGLILLTGALLGMLSSGSDRDRLLAAFGAPQGRLVAAGVWADHKLLQAVAGAIVAWGVSFPLVATHFQQLNPWGVACSILMAPLVFLALVGAMMKVILTLLWPSLAEWWTPLAAEPVSWMRGGVDLLAKLPFSEVPLPAPPPWLVAIFYLALLAALHPWRTPAVRWMIRTAPLMSAFAILVLPYQTTGTVRPAPDELRVTLLAVGAGQCAVIEPPSGRVVLMDVGSSSLSDLLRKCLAPFLRHQGRTNIDTVIISHPNYDHFSGAAEVVAAYDVREVLSSALFRQHSLDNPPAEGLLRSLDQLDRPPRVLGPGERIPLGRETELEVLWPPADRSNVPSNEASLVMRLTHAGRSILFTGDIQNVAMRELLLRPERLKADVLIAPHHGSSEDLTPALLRHVGAGIILSSNDRTLTMKQRQLESLVGDAKLFRTHRCGAITIRIDRDGNLSVQTWLDVDE